MPVLLSGGSDAIVLVTSASEGAEAKMVEWEGGADPCDNPFALWSRTISALILSASLSSKGMRLMVVSQSKAEVVPRLGTISN